MNLPVFENSLFQNDSYQSIARVQFRTRLKNLYIIEEHKSSFLIHTQLFLSGEFNEPFESSKYLHSWSFQVYSEDWTPCDFVPSIVSIVNKDPIYKLTLSFPFVEGSFFLQVNGLTNDPSILICPIISNRFSICRSSEKSINCLQSLINYRIFPVLNDPNSIKIIEDYGATIGSHVYDCAIVFLRYFYFSDTIFSGPILEISSGCGLVGLYLGLKTKQRIILTDIASQLPLTQLNIQMNEKLSLFCDSRLFNWKDSLDTLDLDQLSLVVASDVLYDSSSTFDIIRLLEISFDRFHPSILVAQKNRNNKSIEELEAIFRLASNRIQTKVKYQEANVLIWELSFLN